MPTIVKSLVDIGPLIVFYVAESYTDIFVATGFLMIACTIAFVVSWTLTRKIALLPLLTLAFALIFGGFTLLFEDDTFIKIEVTMTNGLLGIFLLVGMYFEKSLLKLIFGDFASLNAKGWDIITWRMGWFFCCHRRTQRSCVALGCNGYLGGFQSIWNFGLNSDFSALPDTNDPAAHGRGNPRRYKLTRQKG